MPVRSPRFLRFEPIGSDGTIGWNCYPPINLEQLERHLGGVGLQEGTLVDQVDEYGRQTGMFSVAPGEAASAQQKVRMVHGLLDSCPGVVLNPQAADASPIALAGAAAGCPLR